MKTPPQYEAEIADLKELIRKMQIQLTAALETVAENWKRVDKTMGMK
jgi:exonuclease VII small subunit